MDTMVDAIQDVVSTEPEAGEPPDTAQPDDAAKESRLAQEISELWSSHVRLSTDRKVTSKELRLIRTRLAQRLHEMKAVLARPGRGGEWRGWLRERRVPRSTADRLVARYAEALGSGSEENVLTGSIPALEESAESLAKTVWRRFGRLLASEQAILRFIGGIVTAAGIAHERREDGLMIFLAAPKVADGVTGNEAAAEITCPTPQPAESGEANPADAPATDPDQQISDDVPTAADELPASAPASDPVPQSITTEEPSGETAATPTEIGQAAAVEAGEGGGGEVAL